MRALFDDEQRCTFWKGQNTPERREGPKITVLRGRMGAKTVADSNSPLRNARDACFGTTLSRDGGGGHHQYSSERSRSNGG